MKLTGNGYFSYIMEITQNDCIEHGIDFNQFKEYHIYKQNKHLYDKIPSYYFEPSAPPKKTFFLNFLFKKKKKEQPTLKTKTSELSMQMEAYYQKKLNELHALGLPIYSKAELTKLYQNHSKLIALVTEYANSESQKEQPPFENRGHISYRYEITGNNSIIFYVNTAAFVL